MSLTRDQILSASDSKTEKVHVPQWGGDVHVRSLTAAERDQWEEAQLERSKKRGVESVSVRMANSRARLVAFTCCDEQGNRLFTDDDVARLSQKSAAAVVLVYNVAARLSGLTDDDIEDLAKN